MGGQFKVQGSRECAAIQGVWHPSGMQGIWGAVSGGIARRLAQPPATFWQPPGLLKGQTRAPTDGGGYDYAESIEP